VLGANTHGGRTVKSVIKSHGATSSVFATLLLIIIVVISGLALYNFVASNVELVQDTFNTQMSKLLLKSFTINSTHLLSWIQNVGSNIVKITAVYINGLLAVAQGSLEIKPHYTELLTIISSFTKGNTYTIKLQGIFGVIATFKVKY